MFTSVHNQPPEPPPSHEWISALRSSLGMTQTEFGIALGYKRKSARSAVAKLEKKLGQPGRNEPSYPIFFRLLALSAERRIGLPRSLGAITGVVHTGNNPGAQQQGAVAVDTLEEQLLDAFRRLGAADKTTTVVSIWKQLALSAQKEDKTGGKQATAG